MYKIWKIKNFGRAEGGNDFHDEFGINSKTTDLQSVIGIEQIWQRIEDETAKEEEKQSELKGVVYRKLFVFAGNNTVWIMESDDRLKALLRTGYDEWMQAEAQKKRQEANATGTGGENGKPKAPTLPPYLWDEDIMV